MSAWFALTNWTAKICWPALPTLLLLEVIVSVPIPVVGSTTSALLAAVMVSGFGSFGETVPPPSL